MAIRFDSTQKPRNWLARREQGRMIILVFLLGGVVFLATQASDPKNWQWFAELDNAAQSEADDFEHPAGKQKIDTRLSVHPSKKTPAGILVMPSRKGAVTADAADTDDRSTNNPETNNPETNNTETNNTETNNTEPPQRFFPGVNADYFVGMRDQTMMRPVDTDAWFHLLQILQLCEQSELEKASTGHITFRQLYDQPSQYRGDLVTLAGKVRRCEKLPILDTSHGIEGPYYRLWFWPRGVNNPLVVHSLEVPKGFPLSQNLEETVEVTGFFFKVWAYAAKDSTRTAPVVLCKTIRWNESKVSSDRIHRPPPKKQLQRSRNTVTDSRSYMEKFWSIDESDFKKFVDGRRIDLPEAPVSDEAATLIDILFRLPSFPLDKLERWAQGVDIVELARSPESYQGEIVHLDGRLEQFEPLELDAAQQRLFNFKTYYRCQLRSAIDDRPIVVYTRNIPESWKQSAPRGELVSANGFFLKAGQRILGLPQLVFAANRLAWHPDDTLGNLGMDAGLLDTIDDRKPITAGEGESFWQMLSVMSQAKITKLAQAAIADQMQRQRSNPDPLIQNLEVPSGSLVLRDLLSDPVAQHGRLIPFFGTALRVTPVMLNDAMRRRFHYDQYYNVDVSVKLDPPLQIKTRMDDGTEKYLPHNEFTVVFCLRELPDGFPTGDSIREQVEISAFFFKLWRVHTPSTLARDRLAGQLTPLMIGPGMKWISQDPAAQAESHFLIGLISAGLFAVSLIGIAVTIWFYRRGDRKFKEETLSRQFAIEEGTSLNDLEVEAQSEPDFSHLDERRP